MINPPVSKYMALITPWLTDRSCRRYGGSSDVASPSLGCNSLPLTVRCGGYSSCKFLFFDLLFLTYYDYAYLSIPFYRQVSAPPSISARFCMTAMSVCHEHDCIQQIAIFGYFSPSMAPSYRSSAVMHSFGADQANYPLTQPKHIRYIKRSTEQIKCSKTKTTTCNNGFSQAVIASKIAVLKVRRLK